ncbi:hypothetical protein [Ideonella paludis]|uniref:hypothetical protein n=1 Tax=Ideonella paludis TaxID=1233411 RepID=UPI003633ABDC
MARLWIKRVALGLLGLLILALLWLWLNPPAILRVGASYAAKIVCSNVFLAQRDAQAVLRDDVQNHGHPLLKYMRVTVDRERGEVHAALLGVVGKGLALHRPGHGCAVVPDGDLAAARAAAPAIEQTASAPPPMPPHRRPMRHHRIGRRSTRRRRAANWLHSSTNPPYKGRACGRWWWCIKARSWARPMAQALAQTPHC